MKYLVPLLLLCAGCGWTIRPFFSVATSNGSRDAVDHDTLEVGGMLVRDKSEEYHEDDMRQRERQHKEALDKSAEEQKEQLEALRRLEVSAVTRELQPIDDEDQEDGLTKYIPPVPKTADEGLGYFWYAMAAVLLLFVGWCVRSGPTVVIKTIFGRNGHDENHEEHPSA